MDLDGWVKAYLKDFILERQLFSLSEIHGFHAKNE